MMTQAEFRSHFDVVHERNFLNHAAYAPLSRPVIQAMNEYFEHRKVGDPATWSIAVDHVEGLRSNYARLIGTGPERIAIMQNTVTGLNVLANGLSWHNGDHVLLFADEFPSNVMPFLNLQSQGVEVEFIEGVGGKILLEQFAERLRPQTRLISISSVQYLTGFRADLRALSDLCHQHDVILSVDAIQSIGLVPTDVLDLGIDFLAAGGHKWMMSPLGTGFLYVTEALQSQLKMAFMGYMGHMEPERFGDFDQDFSPQARRFELGAFNAPSIVGARAATSLLLDCGIETIFLHVRNLLKQFEYGLEETNFKPLYAFSESESSGIFMFTHENPSKNEAVFTALVKSGTNLSLRGQGLRIAPHYYNNVEDIERLIDLLSEF